MTQEEIFNRIGFVEPQKATITQRLYARKAYCVMFLIQRNSLPALVNDYTLAELVHLCGNILKKEG